MLGQRPDQGTTERRIVLNEQQLRHKRKVSALRRPKSPIPVMSGPDWPNSLGFHLHPGDTSTLRQPRAGAAGWHSVDVVGRRAGGRGGRLVTTAVPVPGDRRGAGTGPTGVVADSR